jgi:predicted metal-dependent hydrolase
MIKNGHPDGAFVLDYAGVRIPFRVEHRKRKKLAITVHPDMRLQVVAPQTSATDQVLSRVEKRAGWILKQWRYFERFQPREPARRYVSGETHLYLGRQYRLKTRQGLEETVKLRGKFLHVWSDEPQNTRRIKELVDEWYRERATLLLDRRLHECIGQCRSLKLRRHPRLTVRKMTHRWGSCTKQGNILLNEDLVRVPVHCVDYVIVHELCHLRVHNHSDGFYRLLTRCMPDWQRRKERLESFVI